jgi:hypothetical protein
VPAHLPAQILLSLHLRILFQPLRYRGVPDNYSLQASVSRLARLPDRRLSLVWMANVYMSLYGRIRLDLRRERAEINTEEKLVANSR